MEGGSSVKFTWVIDNLEKFAYEGESYSVVFKKPAEHKLRVRYFICLYVVKLAQVPVFDYSLTKIH